MDFHTPILHVPCSTRFDCTDVDDGVSSLMMHLMYDLCLESYYVDSCLNLVDEYY